MEKKTGTAATKAKNKYNAANYDRLSPFVKKGKKDRYRAAAEAAGYSLNEAPVSYGAGAFLTTRINPHPGGQYFMVLIINTGLTPRPC